MKQTIPQQLRELLHWLSGAAALAVCALLGRWISALLSLPIPGSVVGMLLLLLGMMLYDGVPRGIALVSDLLLRLLALLFLPAAVGFYFLRDLNTGDWLGLLAATILGTLLSLTLCALLLKKLLDSADARHNDE